MVMVIKLLRAWGAGITAFVNELSPFDFPILGDYAAGSLEHDLDDYEDDGYLLWPVEDSSVAASATEVGPGGDAPAPPGYPDHRLMCAAANGLALWIESGTCEQPTYWGSIVRELGK
jgi:hypothetical protein